MMGEAVARRNADEVRRQRTRVMMRELTDDDLAGEVPFGGRQMPAETLATASYRHVEGHLASIRAAVEGTA